MSDFTHRTYSVTEKSIADLETISKRRFDGVTNVSLVIRQLIIEEMARNAKRDKAKG